MIRLLKLGISFVVLLVLLLVADRLAARVAGQVVADRIKDNQHLTTTPKVVISGFPFLTQMAKGSYDEVHATAVDVPLGKFQASVLDLHLYGVQLKAKDVITQSVKAIPVDRATGTVTFTYADLNQALKGEHVTLEPAAEGGVKVSGSVTVAGHKLSGSGVGSLAAAPGGIRVTVTDLNGTGLTRVVAGLLDQRLSFVIPTTELPYGLKVASVETTPVGLVATAAIGSFTIPVSG